MGIWNRLSEKTQSLAKFISAVTLLVGFVTGICSWGIGQVMDHVDERIDRLEVTVGDTRQDTVRLQLYSLIRLSPEDHENIIKIAKVYFRDLEGDWWMTAVFQEWADSQGVNVTNLMKGAE